MSPAALSPEPTFAIHRMEKTLKEKHDFGAVITGLDLDNISGKLRPASSPTKKPVVTDTAHPL